MRQGVGELDPARVLVPPEAILRPLDQVAESSSPPSGARTTTAQISSPCSSSANADDRDLGDRRVPGQHLLDLARVDVEAAPDDQVLLAVDDRDEAVVVFGAEVAGAEPAVDDGLRRRLRLVVVAGEDVMAPDDDLAELADRQELDPVVEVGARRSRRRRPRSGGRRCPACAPKSGWLWSPSARSRTGRNPRRSSDVEHVVELVDHRDRQASAARDARLAGEGSRSSARAPRPSSAMYIVGTPGRRSRFSRIMRSSAAGAGRTAGAAPAWRRAGTRGVHDDMSVRTSGTAAGSRAGRHRSAGRWHEAR